MSGACGDVPSFPPRCRGSGASPEPHRSTSGSEPLWLRSGFPKTARCRSGSGRRVTLNFISHNGVARICDELLHCRRVALTDLRGVWLSAGFYSATMRLGCDFLAFLRGKCPKVCGRPVLSGFPAVLRREQCFACRCLFASVLCTQSSTWRCETGVASSGASGVRLTENPVEF